ncbi:MAG: response regulator [Ekhidna sp.]|nr:response regulator [Ekhidna sp.]MBC6410292.1 response regulator [Ekhidna sp.]MBC6425087.1 response regulator [Ekhidna sp.]
MSKKIIIAEDSNIMQSLTKKILSQLKYEITPVKNGQEVLDTISNEVYDLILLDINMPVMDGMECVRSIRAMDGIQKDIPIIVITGNGDDYTEEDFEAVGINAFVPKPIDYDSLLKQVKKVINDN